MTLPNLLTIARILAIPIIISLLLSGDASLRWAALVLFALAAITDWLDGYLARKFNDTSPLGRMLDPIADKLLVCALLLTFAFDGTFSLLDLVAAIAILGREMFISGLREFLGNQNIVLHVSKLAKYKTTLQLIAIGVYFAVPMMPVLAPVASALFWAAALLTVWTGWEYFRGALPHLMRRT